MWGNPPAGAGPDQQNGPAGARTDAWADSPEGRNNPYSHNPPEPGIVPQDPGAFASWFAHQPQSVQEHYPEVLGDLHGQNKNMSGVAKGIRAKIIQERQQSFYKGVMLPGVDMNGTGAELTPETVASIQKGWALQGQADAVGAVSKNINDYTWTPTKYDVGADLRLKQLDKPTDLSSLLDLSAKDQTRSDTTGVDAQKGILARDTAMLDQGGLSAIERARMAESHAQNEQLARSQREAIMAQAEGQGRGGGNASLLGRLTAEQGATNRNAMDQLQTNAQALQRSDTIRGEIASTGNQIQTAQDAIDNFNTQGARDRQHQYNAGKVATWDEGNARDKTNTSIANAEAGDNWTRHNYINDKNTSDVNEAGKFNVGPNQGTRGMAGDLLGATNPEAAGLAHAASESYGLGQHKADADAAAKYAYLSLIPGAATTGGEIFSQLYGGSGKKNSSAASGKTDTGGGGA